MSRPWFENKNCSSVTITKYVSISKHNVVQSLRIDNADFVEHLMKRIDALHADGDMMVSFGPDAEHMELYFEGEVNPQIINFYSKKIKTPSTGFNSYKSQQELSVYRDIEALLFPEISKEIFKIKNLKIQFPDFTITYLGSSYSEEAPVSISFTTDLYSIRDKKGVDQTLKVISGQLPPGPVNFDIENKSFLLHSFRSDEERMLYPDYFQIM